MRAVGVCLILLVTAHMSVARILTACQLLGELKNRNVPGNDLATWLCIAQRESALNTAARGGPNTDGSYDNGIFQINNRYWCSDNGAGGDCHVNCAALRDDNLNDDITCALKIKSIQGFPAWTTYPKYCTNAVLPRC